MHSLIELISIAWLVVWKTAANLLYGSELGLYLALDITNRDKVGAEVLKTLSQGNGSAEIRLVLWWDQAWATQLLRQHERRERLKDVWR